MSELAGVVVVDKPRGPTSFDVVAQLRRVLGEKRIGHTGTLDPMATGVLPVCVGEACKLVPFLTDCDKTYEAEVVFGVRTSTGDAEGEVVQTRDASGLDPARVAEQATSLVGHITQKPPMYSAVRVDGRRLYELAREGKEVERVARPIVVHALLVTPIEGPRYRLSIRCGKGTYVRVIAEDLGELLGVGAHLSALRRTRVGRFEIADAIPLDQVSASTRRVGLADAIAYLPTLALDETGARRIRAGQERWLLTLAQPPAEGRSRLIDSGGGLVAVISRTGQKILFERVFVDKHPSSEAKTAHNNTTAEQSRDACKY